MLNIKNLGKLRRILSGHQLVQACVIIGISTHLEVELTDNHFGSGEYLCLHQMPSSADIFA
jgi:hypothetical protein